MLMDEQSVEALLVCSRANVGYLADYTYYTAQALPFLLEDGREWSLSFVGIPRDPMLGAFITPVTGEEGIIRHADPWIEDRRLWGPPWAYVAAIRRLGGAPVPSMSTPALISTFASSVRGATIAAM